MEGVRGKWWGERVDCGAGSVERGWAGGQVVGGEGGLGAGGQFWPLEGSFLRTSRCAATCTGDSGIWLGGPDACRSRLRQKAQISGPPKGCSCNDSFIFWAICSRHWDTELKRI